MFQHGNLKDCLMKVLNPILYPPPSLNHICFRAKIKFDSQCLKQDKVIFNHKTVVDIYIVY